MLKQERWDWRGPGPFLPRRHDYHIMLNQHGWERLERDYQGTSASAWAAGEVVMSFTEIEETEGKADFVGEGGLDMLW